MPGAQVKGSLLKPFLGIASSPIRYLNELEYEEKKTRKGMSGDHRSVALTGVALVARLFGSPLLK